MPPHSSSPTIARSPPTSLSNLSRRPWVRRLGGLAVLAIVLQAVLGGITVLFYLPVDISVAHACLAQLFFCITVSLALFTSPDWRWDEPKIEDASAPSLREMATLT